MKQKEVDGKVSFEAYCILPNDETIATASIEDVENDHKDTLRCLLNWVDEENDADREEKSHEYVASAGNDKTAQANVTANGTWGKWYKITLTQAALKNIGTIPFTATFKALKGPSKPTTTNLFYGGVHFNLEVAHSSNGNITWIPIRSYDTNSYVWQNQNRKINYTLHVTWNGAPFSSTVLRFKVKGSNKYTAWYFEGGKNVKSVKKM